MDLAAFLRGGAIGLAVAAPVGPVGLLCIRRTLSGGAAVGFASGLGAAAADAAYATMAALGTGAAMRFLDDHAAEIGIASGTLLLVLAAPFRGTLETSPAPLTAVRTEIASGYFTR